MKKIYILASAVVIASSSFAQSIGKDKVNAKPTMMEPTEGKISKQNFTKKAPGDVFWYEDFGNALAGNSVDGSGNSIGGAWTRGFTGAPETDFSTNWVHTTQGPQGQYSANGTLNSTSKANGWFLFDANIISDTDPNVDEDGFININGYLESPDIDISAMGSCIGLEYQQVYRTCCAGGAYPVDLFAGYFDVTANAGAGGWIWSSLYTGNDSHNDLMGSGPSGGQYTPDVRTISIASIADNALGANGNGNIRIRFHWNSDGNASNSYYFWMIDDVKIKEIDTYEFNLPLLTLNNLTATTIDDYDFDYYYVPSAQSANRPVHVYVDAISTGCEDFTAMNMEVEVSREGAGIVHTENSPNQVLEAGEIGFISHRTTYSPSTVGKYTTKATLISTEGSELEVTPADNTLSQDFEVTSFEMGHANPDGDIGVYNISNGGRKGKAMVRFKMSAPGTVYGLKFWLIDGTTVLNTPGQIAKIVLYNDARDQILNDQQFVLATNYINSTEPVAVRFEKKSSSFNAGDLFWASLESNGGGQFMVVMVDYNSDYDGSARIDQNGRVYGTNYDPYINLSFDPTIQTTLSVNEIKNNNGLSLMQNIPNPADFSTEIRYSLGNTANVTLEVVDVTGKVIATHALGMRAAGDHSFELNTSDFADGIYYYTLTAGADRLSNKMVVRK
jgi:hypothetical protein